MNNETARELLSAYRPNGADANDPRFADSLERCRRDPELGRWFDGERRFDGRIASVLQEMSVPAAFKQGLMAAAQLETEEENVVVPFFQRPMAWGALAAGLALLLGVALWFPRDPSAAGSLPVLAAGQPAAEVVDWLDSLRSLDFHAEDPRAVLSWLTDQAAPVPAALPAALEEGMVNGCKVFLNARGKPVTLICFMSRGQVLHYFTWDLDRAASDRERQPTMFAQGTWQGAGWADGDQGHALIGRVSRAEIDELVTAHSIQTL